ncbi:MAG: LCP family protein [Oscillospiraceae bacterium]|nr:LCP family protein [Oscillospiraceae bacterium]
MSYHGKHAAGSAAVRKANSEKEVPKGKALLVVAIVLLILIILFSIGAIAIQGTLNKIRKADNSVIVSPDEAADEIDPEDEVDPANKPPEMDEKDVDWAAVEALENENLINLLLVGQDSRTGARERSDTMIVVSINPDTGDISMISFMRDLYVQMPEGYMDNRMNAAYAFGGFPYLYEVLEKNFGLKCAGGFEVNFDGFTRVVDTLGGVDVELSSSEARIVGEGAVAGMNHLTGSQALTYSRIRKIDSDFNRTNRQRTVLLALFEKVKGADLNTLLDLTNTLLPMMTTDLTNTQILSLVMKLAPMMSGMQLRSYRIPVDGGYYDATIRGMMVLVPYLEMNRESLKTYLPYSE